jgi:alpha-beta hydrolase superfamily lysophospholipase
MGVAGQALLPWARRLGLWVALPVLLLYLASLLYLSYYQRDFLFVRGRHATPLPESFRAMHLKEADGTRLTVWRAPVTQPGRGTLVFFYGNAGTVSDFADIADAFHREGYGVVLASYRGYDGNDGLPSEDGLVADARSVIGSLNAADGPVILWGQSLGTGVVAHMAAEGRARAVILQSPYTAIVDVAAAEFWAFPVRLVLRDRFDTESFASRIHVPVLIMHGTSDMIVPFWMGAHLAPRLHATFVAMPGYGHNNLPHDMLFMTAESWLRQERWATTASSARRSHR